MAKPAAPLVEQFGQWIGVGPLLDLVAATSPWIFSPARSAALSDDVATASRLIALRDGADGWWRILLAARTVLPSVRRPTPEHIDEYLALCCAAHHATVGSFTPTDVDAKIRGVLWREVDARSLTTRWSVIEAWRGWDERRVSTRGVMTPQGLVSGHDGERLGCYMAALGAATGLPGGDAVAAAAHDVAAAEVLREAVALRHAIEEVATGRGDPVHLLRLAWICVHNVGDINQGLSFWPDDEAHRTAAVPFARLAHENAAAYGGAFYAAKRLYQLVENEGHRNYPLRQARCLRPHPELLLPLGPCLETWGEAVARHPKLQRDDHQEVLSALADGCRKVPGQHGYYRALVGMREGLGGTFDRLTERLATADRKFFADGDSKRRLAISAPSFHASLGKQVRAVVGDGRALFAT